MIKLKLINVRLSFLDRKSINTNVIYFLSISTRDSNTRALASWEWVLATRLILEVIYVKVRLPT